MGKAEKANPMSDTNREKVGAYNVRIRITYVDGTMQEVDAERWVHNNDYLALNITSAHLMLVSLCNVLNYSVIPQAEMPKIVT